MSINWLEHEHKIRSKAIQNENIDLYTDNGPKFELEINVFILP